MSDLTERSRVKYRPDMSVPLTCPLLPELRDHVDGECDRCGVKLSGRRKKWCSDDCAAWAYREFSRQHDWGDARKAAIKRDGLKCVTCGEPERTEQLSKRWGDGHVYRSNLSVNHIVPRLGRGYGRGCHNHLDNLETLCWPCHNKVTAKQRTRVVEGGLTMDEINALMENIA